MLINNTEPETLRVCARRASFDPLGLDPTPKEYAAVLPKTTFGL